jgi:hypothetical protein
MSNDRENSHRPKPHLKLVPGTKREGKPKTGKAKPSKGGRTAPNALTGLTEKQESFCQNVMSGMNYSDAYREAYDTSGMKAPTIWAQASTLAANHMVAARIEQLAAEKEGERRALRLSRGDRVLAALEVIAEAADTSDAARVRALELIGKSVALWSDRIEVEDTSDRSADDIEAAILRKLGQV